MLPQMPITLVLQQMNAVNAANLGVTVDASAADGTFTVTGDAGTGAFTVDLVANDNGDGANTATVTDSGSSTPYAADSYSLTIGSTSVSADYRTDAAATAAARRRNQ